MDGECIYAFSHLAGVDSRRTDAPTLLYTTHTSVCAYHEVVEHVEGQKGREPACVMYLVVLISPPALPSPTH